MNHPWKKMATAGLICAAALGGWLATPASPLKIRPAANGGLEVNPADLDFGRVWVNDAFAWELPIHNPGPQEVVVTEFHTSCGCTKITPKSLVIPARGTSSLALDLDLLPGFTEQLQPLVWDFSVRITPRVRGNPSPALAWSLHGQVKTPFQVTPGAVHFEGDLIRGEPCPSKSVTVIPDTQLSHLEATSKNGKVKVHVSPESGSYRVDVSPAESVPVGVFTDRVLLHGVTASGVSLPPIPFSVSGRLLDDLQFVPETVQLGIKSVGTVCSEAIVLRSRCGRTFAVTALECSEGLTVSPADTASGDSYTYTLRQRIAEPGAHSGSIRVAVSSGDGPQRTVSLLVQYYGKAEDGGTGFVGASPHLRHRR